MGPCIEVWADRDPLRSGAFDGPWWRARRAWRAAAAAWATSAGVEDWQVRNLARTSHVWSRRYLRSSGRADLVDYLEGRRSTPPDDPVQWHALAGLSGVSVERDSMGLRAPRGGSTGHRPVLSGSVSDDWDGRDD